MKKPHRAWGVCLGCTLMLLIASGLGVNAFSVTQPYILAQNGFTNTETSMIVTVRSVSIFVCMFLSPLYFKKLGYRVGTALATAFAAAGFALFACAKTREGYYLAAAVLGFSHGFGSMIPTTILMARWFNTGRGTAIGICAAGTGLATVVFSPILRWLIENVSLSGCFWFEAALSLAGAAAVFLLVQPSPEQCGLTPCGKAQEESAQEKRLHSIHPSPLRWTLLYAGMIFLGAVASTGFSHMMILFTTAGFSSVQASSAVSLFGFALMTGKCVYGMACDRLGTPRSNGIFGALMLAGLSLCAMAELQKTELMYLAAGLYGVGVSLNTVGLSVWATDFSQPEQIAGRVQRFQLCYSTGSMAFSFLPGAIADLTGSYAPAYALFFALCVYALVVVQSTYRMGTRQAART